MPRPKADYDGMIDLPDDPGPSVKAVVQSDDRTNVQSYDQVLPAPPRTRSRKAAKPEPEPKKHVQRSLYATEETFEAIRRLSFETHRPAQEFYREGLFLVMKKYGLAQGKSVDDV